MVLTIEDDYTYQVECEYEPAQNGGMDDPSWSAYLDIDTVTVTLELLGREVTIDVTKLVDLDRVHELAWEVYKDDPY